jgi:transcriptional regulator with XRE-family HTH domain
MSTQRGEEGEFRIDELYIAAAKEFIESAASNIALVQVSGVHQISFDSLNLEALANALNVFGWTDPIGEIKQWFYDRLKEISSFFSSVVETIINPIRNTISSIWNFIQGIPNAVVSGIRGFIDTLSRSITSLADSVRSYFTQIISQISSVITSIANALKDTASSLMRSITNILSSVSASLQNFVSTLVSRLMDGIKTVGTALSNAFEKLSSAISEIARRILEGVKSFFTTIGETMKSFWQSVIDNLGKLGSMISEGIQKGISWLWDSVQGIVGKVWEGIQSFGKMVSDVFGKVWEGIQSGLKVVWDQIQGFGKWLWDSIQGGLRWLWDTLTSIGAKIWEGLQWFGNSVADFFGRVWEGIQSGLRWVWDQLQGFGRWLWDQIQGGLRWLWDVLTSIGSKIWEGLQWFGGSVVDFFGKVWEGIQGGIMWIWDQLQGFGRWLWDQIYGGLQWLWDVLTGIGSKIWEGLQWFGKSVADFFTMVWEGIKGVGDWIWSGIQGFAEQVQRVFADIGSRVMGALTTVGNTLTNFGRLVIEGFTRIGTALSDFAKIFDKWAVTLWGGINTIGRAFDQFLQTIANLPKTLENMFKGAVDFFTKVGEGLREFISNPGKWFQDHIISPLWSGLQRLGGKIWEGLQWLWQKIAEGAQWLWNAIQQVGQWIINALSTVPQVLHSAFTDLANILSSVGKNVYGFFIDIVSSIAQNIGDAVQKFVKGVISSFMGAVGWGTPPGLTTDNFVKAWGTSFLWSVPLFTFALAVEIPIRGVAYLIKYASRVLSGLESSLRVKLTLFGIGGEFEANLIKAIGDALSNFSKELEKHADKFYEPFWMGMGFWYGKFASMLLTYNLRNFIPIEMPTLREAEELWNRVRATALTSFKIPEDVVGKPEDAEDVIINFLKIRGFSDYILKLAFADDNEFYLEIEDRFKAKRKIPLADAWRVPPPSDIITMMIRDVIIEPQYFTAVMRMQGFNKDTSILYYYLRFKYPSPEKLAEFYWRGMAKVLWYDKTLEEERLKTFLGLEAYEALPPVKLNERPDILNNMIMVYMKWHDYAPFPWDNEFPTDKSIIVELMADLPDKVDFRWLCRWAILEHMSALGVSMNTTIDKIIEKLRGAKGDELLRKQVTPEISLDVSLLARFLIARGIHPYFASIAAVAESHVMLADEMTLLRTGFLELYRWGMANVDQLEQLMSGLFVIKFTTGYIDSDGKPVTYTYNKPVLWLPAERRLLQLRSAMDRYYMLFRDFVREVERGVRFLALHTKSTIEEVKKYVSRLKLDKEASEAVSRSISILESYKKADELIREYGSIVTDMLSREIKDISGADIRFTLDDKYIETWVKAAELVRDIESRTWIRHYATRLVAWIIYRTSYGWTPVEKFKNLSAILMARGWLTIEEKEFLDTVAEWVYGIVRREMIPTPIQLATFSEYMKVPDDLIDKVLDEHRVPDEYRQLYKQYIAFRFIKSDYRTFLNRARRAYVLGIINDEEWINIIAEAVNKYGFRQEEIAIMQRLAELEELMESVRVWRPSLTTIATISEVVPIPEDVMNKVFEKFRVDPLIAPYVKEYVRRRPLLDELRSLVNEYYRLRHYADLYKQAIPSDVEQAVQRYMQLFGLTEEEKAVRELVARMRELAATWRESARENVPTPSMLATIYEYVPTLTGDMINKVFEARGVPPEWRKVWLDYFKNRVIADDVRALVSAFYRLKRYAARYGQAVPEDVAKAVEGYMARIGFTEEEKRIRDLASEIDVTIELWRENTREYIPTPSMLATIYEYVPTLTDNDIVEVLKLRNVPDKWISIWIKYIKSRSIADDVRVLVSAYSSLARYATRYGQKVPDEITNAVQRYMQLIGFSKEELEVRQLVASIYELIESWRENAREYIPTPSMLATISEYVPSITDEMINRVLEARRVPQEWRSIWVQYIKARAIADEVRSMLNAFYRLKRYAIFYGYSVPKDIEDAVAKYAAMIGVTDVEKSIRDMTAYIEATIDMWRTGEVYPTLSVLASMSEYIDVPVDYIKKVIEARRIESTYASLWLQYIAARTISGEVNRVVSAFTNLYVRYAVPEDVVKRVIELMASGGWTSREIRIFGFELELRRTYRVLTMLVPSMRQFITDAQYIPDYEKLFQDILQAYAIDVEKYKKQVEYYKRLLKNRRLWRHFSWYRTQLTYALMYGSMTENEIRQKLRKFVSIGLIDEDELDVIIDGMKIRAVAYATYRALRYGR